MHTYAHKRAFTLIELMVIIGIVTVILAVVLTSFSAARENSRDKNRVSDLSQLEFALSAYKEVYKEYPQYDAGIIVGQNQSIDSDLASFWTGPVADPINDDDHYYYYDSDFECRERPGSSDEVESYVAILAVNTETGRAGSADCPLAEAAYQDAYIVLIDGPLNAGSPFEAVGEIEDNDSWWTEEDNQTYPPRPPVTPAGSTGNDSPGIDEDGATYEDPNEGCVWSGGYLYCGNTNDNSF